MNDEWLSGNDYEPYMGRWSRAVASEFRAWLAVPHGKWWLDVGCGTGALTQMILAKVTPDEVQGIDRSEAFVRYARRSNAGARFGCAIADARALPYESESFDVVVSGLVLNLVPEPASAVREMARVARRDGAVAIYVWDYAGRMKMMRYFWDAAVELNSEARDLDGEYAFLFASQSRSGRYFKQPD